MMRILAAAALAALIATPAPAQTTKPLKKQKAAYGQTYAPQAYSPSGNPEWDVYVRGEYVGSDPDPRVRATIRSDAVRNYNASR